MVKKSLHQWQFGDFQTPSQLAQKIVTILADDYHLNPDLILEPTCGKGSFLRAAIYRWEQAKVIGFDINYDYVEQAKESIQEISNCEGVLIQQGDFFQINWNDLLKQYSGNKLLVFGNPPWVTSSELSLINSQNCPTKSNFQNRRGLEAITGLANFDVSEWMLLQYVDWLSDREGSLAIICKYSVARKVIKQVRKKYQKQRFFAHIYPIDTKLYFGITVSACLFILTTDQGNADCEIYPTLDSKMPSHVIGEREGLIVNDVKQYEKWKHLRGQSSPYIWRSGVKHDCAKVMELEPLGKGYKNGFGEIIHLESEFIYPLLKSSDVGNSRIQSYRKVILMTQRFLREDTSHIKELAPKTWDYLNHYQDLFLARKSSIYKNQPLYSIFGVGAYTFKPWKIAISGFYKKLNFCLVGLMNEKPVIFDDTVIFLSFDLEGEARFIFNILTSEPATQFLESIIFWDEKRPITANILKQLSIPKLAKQMGNLQEYQSWIQKHSSI